MAKDTNSGNSAFHHAMAIAGAISLLGLSRDIGTWQADIGSWIDAFREISRPVANFLFGWVAQLVGWELAGWQQDYLIVGIVAIGAWWRAGSGSHRYYGFGFGAFFLLASLFAWPLVFIMFLMNLFKDGFDDENQRWASVFIYFALFVAVNYGLIYSGSSVAP